MTCFTIAEEIATPMIVAPAAAVEASSFGWADFPAVVSTSLSENTFSLRIPLFEKPIVGATSSLSSSSSCVDDVASDATASTLEDSDWCDDDSILSELEEEENEVTSSSSSMSSLPSSKSHRRVTFGQVHIRQHNVIVGVHPMASGGYALELGWEYNDATTACSVNMYERNKRRSALRRLSVLERRYKLAEMSGESLLQVAQQEQQLRAQTTELERAQSTTLQSSSPPSISRQVNRCTSYTHLSALV